MKLGKWIKKYVYCKIDEKNEKSQNQFQNGLMQIRRTRVKKGQSKSKRILIYYIIYLHTQKRRKILSEERLKKIAKIQKLSQNELN